MTQSINFNKDLISEHRERMLNLKKYYPFFKLAQTSFSQFKDGRFEELDMGFICMAVLRFFIEENNFREKDVTYPEYVVFIKECLKENFGIEEDEQTTRELADFIFDKLKNEGKPFVFEYYDPLDRKKKISRIKLIESRIQDHIVWYTISAEAVEFYLDTKEIRDESKISVQQLLLEKMIQAKDFKGGTQVVDRINSEVSRLLMQQNEVLAQLSADVFTGIKCYEDFVANGMRWFDEEQKLFVKNRELIEGALAKTESERFDSAAASEGYLKTVQEIFQLETQLKIAMNRHSQLLSACTQMAKNVDDIIRKTKLSRLRSQFDFKTALKDIMATDDATLLETMIIPLMKPRVVKHFALENIDAAVSVRPDRFEEKEEVVLEKEEEIKFEDELEDERIGWNYAFLMSNLLNYFKEKPEFTLKNFNTYLSVKYGDEVFKNADYYSFMLHLCQKRSYEIGKQEQVNESFLDDILTRYLVYDEKVRFEILPMNEAEMLEISGVASISNMQFRIVTENMKGSQG